MHAPTSPSSSLLQNLRRELGVHAPFSQMAPEHVDRFVAHATQTYFAPEEVVLEPAMGVMESLYFIRQGSIVGRRGLAETAGGFQYEAGDLFPVGALMNRRAVTATYTADEDTFCLIVPAAEVRALAEISPPFASFLNHRVAQFLDLSRQALQASSVSQVLAEQSLESPLSALPRREPVTVPPDAPLAEALQLMHDRRIGSVLVADDTGHALGILTRHDVLGRVTLPRLPLETPISQVMSSPLSTLTLRSSAQEAALLMSRLGIRHVPVTDNGRVVTIISERDLFALQRLSLKNVSTGIRATRDVAAMRARADDIRRFARNLLGQGVRARQLTELISHLNDVLVAQLVGLVAAQHGLDLQRACWLAFGSEGRGEQTVATDQDNGLVFESDDPARDRPRWLAFALEVNEALDACGYPLCKGKVMASNPECCLTASEWVARFEHWMEHGAPEDLLNASIYFDLRAVAGRLEMAAPLRDLITRRAAALPRFMKQLALNALAHRPPLNWRGALDTRTVDGRQVIDLKLQGTAIFVDAARLYALAHGLSDTSTRARLDGVSRTIGLEPQEGEAWIRGFEFLQSLRLLVQLDPHSRVQGDPSQRNPNLVDVDALNEIDRRMLKESLRIARRLQQRMELDYQR